MNISPDNRNIKRMTKGVKLDGFSSRKTKAVREAIIDYIKDRRASFSQDRALYGASLIKTWASNAAQIDLTAEKLLAREPVIASRNEILNIYMFFTIAIFAPLADNLNYDEEAAIRELSDKLREAWRKFFGAVRVYNPGIVTESFEVESAALQMQDFLEDFFLGEVEPELTNQYNVNAALLMKVTRIILENSK